MCKEICLHDPNCEAYEVNQMYSGKNYEECTITGRNINSCPNGADLCKDYDDVWNDSDRDYWMTSNEAKDYGMIDEVLMKKSK